MKMILLYIYIYSEPSEEWIGMKDVFVKIGFIGFGLKEGWDAEMFEEHCNQKT